MADQAEKAIFQLREAVKGLLVLKLGQDREELARVLTEGDLDDDHPNHLRCGDPSLSCRSTPTRPTRSSSSWCSAPQPVRRQASVEHLSKPRHRPAALVVETPQGLGLDHET